MFNHFRKYLEDKIIISEGDYQLIESVCIIKKLRKHQFLLSEGDVCTFNGFVCDGFLRKYSVDDRGTEHTVYFATENWWIADRFSLMEGTPSKYYIDAIENSAVLLISKLNYEMICEKIPAFKDMVNQILQRSLNATHERINTTLQSTAEEKYNQFLKSFPNLANRTPRHILASYLGITPETLSRIRKQVSSK
ncbi:Crp/Fnr family transcriptional regulator [Mucilaginibacter sp. HC2]|uniref:Crp/Fnr family transcriptional regulator n=1 Tax=Mucilaginibacter inviolabilis TaxID=2714892 RepID=UPI001408DEAE|nr:Crp/Fnr family transcriptional regulator [Mucilaginibacter inviolabilis]NHA08090.1 Crp/Fnr family transcriptional regulator [Mucilaginibacter inviolabilis]